MASLKSIEKITLKDLLMYPVYSGLAEGLTQLPVTTLKLAGKRYSLPTYNEFVDSLCYGQRLFLVKEEKEDISFILRVIDGYFYPIVKKCKWNEDKALLFGKKVLTCKAIEIYPFALQLMKYVSDIVEREHKLLHRKPTKIEQAAGIEKLNIFSELTALDFLRDQLKCSTDEVLLTPYNECLVRFMLAKETFSYQERYTELLRAVNK